MNKGKEVYNMKYIPIQKKKGKGMNVFIYKE